MSRTKTHITYKSSHHFSQKSVYIRDTILDFRVHTCKKFELKLLFWQFSSFFIHFQTSSGFYLVYISFQVFRSKIGNLWREKWVFTFGTLIRGHAPTLNCKNTFFFSTSSKISLTNRETEHFHKKKQTSNSALFHRFHRVLSHKRHFWRRIRNQRENLPRNPFSIRLFIVVLRWHRFCRLLADLKIGGSRFSDN